MANEQCRNCRFSKSVSPGLICRRYPPLDGDGRFPACDPYDWCGEWMAMRPGAGLPAEITPPKAPKPGPVAGGKARAAALTRGERRAQVVIQAARNRWSRS